MIVVVRVRWPEIEDLEMKEWGAEEISRFSGGEAVQTREEGRREAVGVYLNVSRDALPVFSFAHPVVPLLSSNQVPKPGRPPAKPGRPPPDPNVADTLMETQIIIVLPSGFEGRDLEVTRIPNRVDLRSYAPTSFGSISGSFEDVVVEAEVGFVGVSFASPHSIFFSPYLRFSPSNV